MAEYKMTKDKIELKYSIIDRPSNTIEEYNVDNTFRFKKSTPLENLLKNSDLKRNDKYVVINADGKNYHVFYKTGNYLYENEMSILEHFVKVEYYTFYLNSYSRDIQSSVLSELNRYLYSLDRNVYLITIRDTVSSYYIEQAFSYIVKFESLFRELMYSFYLEKYNEQWFEVVIRGLNASYSETVRGRMDGVQRIEKGLQAVTLGNMRHMTYFNNSGDDGFKEFMEMNDILEEKVSYINEIRNTIAHLNEFHEEEFIQFKREIDVLLDKFEESKRSLVSIHRKESLDEIMSSLHDRMSEIGRYGEIVLSAMSDIGSGVLRFLEDNEISKHKRQKEETTDESNIKEDNNP